MLRWGIQVGIYFNLYILVFFFSHNTLKHYKLDQKYVLFNYIFGDKIWLENAVLEIRVNSKFFQSESMTPF